MEWYHHTPCHPFLDLLFGRESGGLKLNPLLVHLVVLLLWKRGRVCSHWSKLVAWITSNKTSKKPLLAYG